MVEKKKLSKPIPMWPIWIIFVVLFLLSVPNGGQGGTYAFIGCLLGSRVIYKKNVKIFGKEYWKNKK